MLRIAAVGCVSERTAKSSAFLAPVCRLLVATLLASAVVPSTGTRADEPPRSKEIWAGADVSAGVWLVYSGATIAPYSGIHDNGPRLRAVTGYGQYSYLGAAPLYPNYKATTAYGEVLAGYLYRYKSLTMKGFAGLSFIDHDITPFDTENISIGGDWGAKGVLEFWYDSGPKSWSSLDLAFTTAHNTASARLRSGYRLWPELSLGVESALNADGQAQCKMALPTQDGCRLDAGDTAVKSLMDFGRAGVFARYEWAGGEVSVSAGALGQFLSAGGDVEINPYVTANFIKQF